MTWAPGELERAQQFIALRESRIAHREMMEEALAAPPEPLQALQADYAALVRDAIQARMPPEDDDVLFPDSPVVVNQDLW